MSKLLPVMTAEKLLRQCRIDPALNDLRTLSGLDHPIFNAVMQTPIYRYAEIVQLAPASENHHHSGPGGLLVHTLEVIAIALKVRKGFQLPLGGSITDIGRQRHLWTYGVFAACLLHDIGKLSSSIRLKLQLKDGQVKNWTPQAEPLTQQKDILGYSIQFQKVPYKFHNKLALTHFDIFPRVARDWIMQSQAVMNELLSYLWGDLFESGIIGEIAQTADRESTARNLQIPVEKSFTNVIPTIDRYLRFIRQWIEEGLIRVNTSGSMGWVDKDGYIYLVCRSLAEKLILECNQQGLKNLPQEPVRIYDILQEHGYALSTESGKAIWTIKVKTPEFDHQLTCLKFESRKLTTPTKPLAPFKGELTVLLKRSEDNLTNETSKDNENETKEAQQKLAKPEPSNTTDNHTFPKETAEKQKNTPQEITHDAAIAAEKIISAPETNGDAEKNHTGISDDPADRLGETALSSKATEEKPEETEESENKTSQETQATMLVTQDKAEEILQNPTFDFSAKDTPKKFLGWLKRGLIEKTILINDVNAEVHIVKEGVFLLAPAIFKTWISRQGLDGNELHKNLSRRFARLRLHIRNGDMNVHSYWVSSSNRASKINGWLLPFNVIYEHGYPIPGANKYISKTFGPSE